MAKNKLSNGQIEKILKSKLSGINDKFKLEVGRIGIVKLILDIISKGIIAVEGFGARYQQYSETYKKQIKGEMAFFTNKGGKAVAVEAVSKKDFESMRGSRTAFWQNEANKEYIAEQAKKFKGKRVSPVNLKLTGEMHGSLDYSPKTGVLKADSEKWVWHNEGMGNLPVRRLLPNKEGERFNRRIQQKITEALAKAIGVETRKAKKFLGVKFNIK